MASWWQNVQNNLGALGNPTYGSLSPQAQQQANMGAFTNIGAQMLQRSNQNPMQAIGGALSNQQQQAGQNARQMMAAKMFEDNQKKAEAEQENTRIQAQAWQQIGPAIANKYGLDGQTFTNLGMGNGLALAKQLGQGGEKATSAMQNFEYYQNLLKTNPDEAAQFLKQSQGGQTINLESGTSIAGLPKGYFWGKDEAGNPTAKPIPGLPTAPDKGALQDQSTVADAGIMMRESKRALDMLEQFPKATTGMAGKLAAMKSDSPAAQVVNSLKVMQSNIGFNRLKQMRQESPTGGALGNVTIGELERLERVLGDLSIYQDPKILRENIIDIQSMYQDMVKKIIDGGGDPSLLGSSGVEAMSNRSGKADSLDDKSLFEKYGVQ